MADKRNIQDELRQMTDPVAYRDNPQSGYDKYIEWWDASKLQNADVNISQYWDDSSAANYNNQSLWGWQNQKYTGENTLGSQVAYNPNATLEWLNPDYKYGQAAQMANSQNANYIASRNDEIASALYNAWKTSIQDVNDFLSTQTGWDYSNANERANTVASVWKRIWQIAQQNNKQEDQPKPERETIKSEDTSGKIYWKATADEWEPTEWIDTLSDANNIYNMWLASRQANLDTLYNMSTDVLAASLATGITPINEQAWTDYQRAYPQLYAEVQRKEKEIRWQNAVNSITTWTENNSSIADTTNLDANLTNYAVNNSNLSVSATQLLKAVDAALASNNTAQSAKELMNSIQKDMSTLKNRLYNLRKEANTVFRGDAPDYLVNAYINNKSQEIQQQLSILEDRYRWAYDIYKTELSHSEFEEEMKLKQDSLDLEWWKAKNSNKTTTTTSDSDYMRTERNNNPTAMITDYAKMLWGVLWEDYEIGDSFISESWATLYTAKLIGDPVEKTIELLDRWLAKWMNIFSGWSYAADLWLTNEVWANADEKKKREIVEKMLKHEWGSLENMSYYRENPWVSSIATNKSGYGYKGWEYGYDPAYVDSYKAFLKWDLSWVQFTNLLKVMGIDEATFGKYVQNWQQHIQNEWNAAWVDVINDLAALWINLQNLERVNYDDEWNLELDVNSWLMFHWSTWAVFDKLLAELKLQRMIKSKQDWANYWQVTEREWDMIAAASTTLKKQAEFNFMWLGPWGTDEWFTQWFMDLLNATWRATFHKELTADDWNTYISDMESDRANLNLVNLWMVNIDDVVVNSNLWWKSDKPSENSWGNQATKDALFWNQ